MLRDYGTTTQAVKPRLLTVNLGATPQIKPGVEQTQPKDIAPEVGELPPCPDDIAADPVAFDMWHFVGEKLRAAGHIQSCDLSVLRIYCETYSLYKSAMDMIKAQGEWIETPPTGALKIAPWSQSRDKHADRLHKLEQKLFLTPCARKALKSKQIEPDLDIDE